MGRPSVYSEELADAICARLEDGESLNDICKDAGMPSERTVRGWASDDFKGFYSKYARAREIGYFKMADEILFIADRQTVDPAAVNRDRLRVDTRKWMLSKVLPKVFGDRTTQDINQTVTINVAFEDYIRSLNEATEPKVINGSLAGEARRVENLPAPLRQGSPEGNS